MGPPSAPTPADGPLRVLLVEPWYDGSHRQWADGYRGASAHRVDVVGLPGQLWRWRLRGGALPLAEQVAAWVEVNGRPDVALISGLVDAAHLVGLTRRALGPTPVVVYQHESQLTYPHPLATGPDQEAALRNWLSWCAADAVWFNSATHRQTVIGALGAFLAQLPDLSHLPLLDRVVARFEVHPVGLDLAELVAASSSRPGPGGRVGEDPVIVWPHRWEADKDPAAFLAALAKAEAAGVGFRLVLAGPDPAAGSSQAAAARQAVVDRFGPRVVAAGPFTPDRYRELVATSDVVVSCAVQENFGVGVVEAVAAGCVPVLPDRLAYPEIIPPAWHPHTLYPPGRFGTALVDTLATHSERRAAVAGLAATMGRFDWTEVGPRYDQALAGVVARARHWRQD